MHLKVKKRKSLARFYDGRGTSTGSLPGEYLRYPQTLMELFSMDALYINQIAENKNHFSDITRHNIIPNIKIKSKVNAFRFSIL